MEGLKASLLDGDRIRTYGKVRNAVCAVRAARHRARGIRLQIYNSDLSFLYDGAALIGHCATDRTCLRHRQHGKCKNQESPSKNEFCSLHCSSSLKSPKHLTHYTDPNFFFSDFRSEERRVGKECRSR